MRASWRAQWDEKGAVTQQQRILMIAALAGADPRTVRKQLVNGKPAHGVILRERIAEAAAKVDKETPGATSPAAA